MGAPQRLVEAAEQLRPDIRTKLPRHVTLVTNTGWGIIRFRAGLIKALSDRGCRISVVADFDEAQQSKLRSLGVEPIALKMDAAGHHPIRDLAYLVRLALILRRLRPELVHLYTIKPIVYGALVARLLGIPGIVTSFPGLGILRAERKQWLQPILKRLIRIALSGRSITIFQNAHDLATFIDEDLIKPSQALRIASSGVDTRALMPDSRVATSARTRFVMASRMLWSKGVADFVEAAHLIKRRYPAASFVVFGGAREDYGSKNPDFIERSWLEKLNQSGVVEWRGWTDPAEVEAAMRGAAAVVLPSYYAEGVPRTLIEAAAAGAPIITTDTPGCQDTVIDGRSGFLCPPRSPESLAAAMEQLMRDPEQIVVMGRESRRHAVATFDERIVIEQTLATYERASAAT